MVNVYKNPSEPKSLITERLKKTGTYRGADVIKSLNDDFRGKCYLCENKGIVSINVEHFVAHRGVEAKRMEWNNLFYCCSHCNNIKGDNDVFNNILNCTDPALNVTESIKLTVDAMPKGEVIVTAISNDPVTKNTVLLLDKIYNGGHTGIKMLEGENLREKVNREVANFIDLLFDYFDNSHEPELVKRNKLLIKSNLNVGSPFAAFKIWRIMDNQKLKDEFSDILPTLDEIYPADVLAALRAA
jgi:hypothetical protein